MSKRMANSEWSRLVGRSAQAYETNATKGAKWQS